MLKKYLSLVKFAHTIFALPFALIGFFLGYVDWKAAETGEGFNWLLLVYVVLCMVFARNAAMGFNRYIDRDIDAKNKRTAVREIPAGKIGAKSALWFVIINCLLFIGTTALINKWCFFLSPVALGVILGYSLTKRFTALCHLVLGLGLALAPVGAYLAVTGHFDLKPILLGVAVLTWVSGFDIIYALQDEDFDKANDLHSIPSVLGKKNALMVSVFLHLLTAGSLIGFTLLLNESWAGWLATGIFCCLLVYQHLLVKPTDLSKVNLAFFTTNGIASVIFSGLMIFELMV